MNDNPVTTQATGDDAAEDPGPSPESAEPPQRAHATPPEPRCSVRDESRALTPDQLGWLTRHARAAIEHLGAPGEVRVRVVRDDEMTRAHQTYLDAHSTTDVITFDLAEHDANTLDTDLLVCADQARREAHARGTTTERELLLYIIHGALHCLGHDDTSPDAAAAMHAREDQILDAIGVGATFALPERDP